MKDFKEMITNPMMLLLTAFIIGVVLLNSYTIEQEEKKVSAANTNNQIIKNK